MPLRRPSYPEVVSTLALVVALSTGGAYAADKVGTAQLKNNAVTSAKIKNGTVAGADLQSGVRRQLASGQPGASLRSGTKLSGTIYEYDHADAAGGYLTANIDLGGPARVPLTDATANFAPDDDPLTLDDDASCTGTFANPTAPVGRVCVYVGGTFGLTALDVETWTTPTIARRAFYVLATKTASTPFEFYATWAYTAP